MNENKLYEVFVTVGGSMEDVLVFTGSADQCFAKCEWIKKNPRNVEYLTRDYMRGWGSGIDDVYMSAKA